MKNTLRIILCTIPFIFIGIISCHDEDSTKIPDIKNEKLETIHVKISEENIEESKNNILSAPLYDLSSLHIKQGRMNSKKNARILAEENHTVKGYTKKKLIKKYYLSTEYTNSTGHTTYGKYYAEQYEYINTVKIKKKYSLALPTFTMYYCPLGETGWNMGAVNIEGGFMSSYLGFSARILDTRDEYHDEYELVTIVADLIRDEIKGQTLSPRQYIPSYINPNSFEFKVKSVLLEW